jgi:hypothetical protein
VDTTAEPPAKKVASGDGEEEKQSGDEGEGEGEGEKEGRQRKTRYVINHFIFLNYDQLIYLIDKPSQRMPKALRTRAKEMCMYFYSFI